MTRTTQALAFAMILIIFHQACFTNLEITTDSILNDLSVSILEDSTENKIVLFEFSKSFTPGSLRPSICTVTAPIQGQLSSCICDDKACTVNYQTKANYSGIDVFTYRLTSGSKTTNEASVNLNVIAQPDAPVAFDIATRAVLNVSKILELVYEDIDRDVATNCQSDFPNSTCECLQNGRCYLTVTASSLNITQVSYSVQTDLTSNHATIQLEVVQPIIITNPPHCAIDARRPTISTDSREVGWDRISFSFSQTPIVPPRIQDFTVTKIGGTITPSLSQVLVTPEPRVFELVLTQAMEEQTWTNITYLPTNQIFRYGFLPGDVNGDKYTGVFDQQRLTDHLSGVLTLPQYSVDINRSLQTESLDILELINLFNGAGDYDPWLNATLPANSCP